MAQFSLSISNKAGTSVSVNGQSEDPDVIAAAQVIIDAFNATATSLTA